MLQSLIQALYPPQCVLCENRTEDDFGLCGSCWSMMPFIDGLCCDLCGTPLPGRENPETVVHCDDCMTIARPWSRGRAALVYKDYARRYVLSLKHGDRTERAVAAGPWLARAAQDIATKDALFVPVPLHRFRLLRRRYNQAALLAEQVARRFQARHLPDALVRVKRTKPLDGHSRDQRFEALTDAIEVNPQQADQIAGRSLVIVDDVMTSGATFAAATEACLAAGASDVCVLALARVAKDA